MDMTMELDELKQAWQSLDRQLEKQNALNLHLFMESKLAKMKSGLRPLVFGQAVLLAVGVLMTVVFAPLWVRNLDTPHLVVYGLSLHVYSVMIIASAARNLIMIGKIDYSAPVLEIQKQLAELRSWQLRSGFWFALIGCFIWTPMLMGVFYWLGADIWVHKPAFVYWCLASSFVAVALTWGLIRFSQRPGQEKLRKAIYDSAAGRSLTRAQAALDEIARFEQD
jgi:hypothetical protein